MKKGELPARPDTNPRPKESARDYTEERGGRYKPPSTPGPPHRARPQSESSGGVLMTVYPNRAPRTLSDSHRRMLYEASGIDAAVAAERGVHTIAHGRDLPEGFSRRQRRRGGGLLFTVHRPAGETAYSYRPDAIDPERPGHRYEQPCKALGGPGNVLDVHPSVRDLVADSSVPVIFVEGLKKADAITSAARRDDVRVVAVAITGVWNWLSDGEPIADMFAVPVDGRKATICFDSDMLRNPNVQDAARRLAEHLIGRGAEVFITYLRDQDDGAKTGADDFLASEAGGTLAELRMLTRRYDPADFVRIRLGRDERLRAMLEDLERRFWATEWKGMGGASARDVYLKLIEAATRHGKVVEDGIRVKKAQGPLALEAKVSGRTLWKCLNRLEEWGLVQRDNEDRKPDTSGAFVLRASVSHYEERDAGEDKATTPLQSLYARDLHLRAPRLRWPQPKYTPKRGLVSGTRKVRQSPKLEPRDRIERLGKICGAMLDVLDAAGGMATLQQIAAALHRARPRDLRRRSLPKLEEAGIVTVSGDTLRFADNWLEALEEQRKLGKEVEAEELARERYRVKSRAYHRREESPKSAPSRASLEAVKRSREQRDAGLDAQRERAAAAARAEEQRRAEAFVLDRLRTLGRIRLALLQDIWRDEGGDAWTIPKAVEASGCRVEELPEYGNRRFVFPPAKVEGVA